MPACPCCATDDLWFGSPITTPARPEEFLGRRGIGVSSALLGQYGLAMRPTAEFDDQRLPELETSRFFVGGRKSDTAPGCEERCAQTGLDPLAKT